MNNSVADSFSSITMPVPSGALAHEVAEDFVLAPPPTYFSMSDLRQRGWSASMVKALLGGHDQLDRNVPHPKRPRRLWSMRRIWEAEDAPEFAARKQRAMDRSTRTRQTLQRASQDVVDAARAVPIDYSGVPLDYAVAVKQTATRFGVMEFADESTGLILGWECLAVEYLIDASAPIEAALDEHFGRPGVSQARAILRERLLDAIAERFPELRNECARRKLCD